MKLHILRALTPIVLMFAVLAAPPAPALDRLSVAYCIDCAPLQFQDENGRPAGLIIDYWRLFSDTNNIEVAFVAAPWQETLDLVATGKVDAHAGLVYSDERDRILDFGTGLHDIKAHLFFHESIPKTSDFGELSAYRIGVIEGDFAQGFLERRLPDGLVAAYPNYASLLDACGQGEIKVFAADTVSALHHLDKARLGDRFSHRPDTPLYENPWLIATREGNGAVIQAVNYGMAGLFAADRRAVADRWTGRGEAGDGLVVAMDRDYAPFSFLDAQGRPDGLLVDLWKAWSEKTGRRIRFRISDRSETLQGLKSGEADVHAGLSYSEEREQWVGFTRQIHRTHSTIYHRAEAPVPADIGAFGDRTIGVVQESFQAAKVRQLYPSVRVRDYSSTQLMIDALVAGEIDAVVEESPVMAELLRKAALGSRIRARPEHLFVSAIHAGVLKSQTTLLEELEAGLAKLTLGELARIESRWITDPDHQYLAKGLELEGVDLTPEERDWLNTHPVLRLGADRGWPPFDYLDDQGRHRGLSAEYLKRIEDILDVTFRPPESLPWSETIARAKRGDLEILAAVAPTPEREAFLTFTKPYMTWPNVIATRNDVRDIASIEDLDGKRVGVVRGYAIEEVMRQTHPELDIVAYRDIAEGLLALSTGTIDAFVDSFGAINHVTKQMHLGNVVVVAPTPYNLEIAFGVRKDLPELATILDKVLASIPAEERTRLLEATGLPSRIPFAKVAGPPQELLTTGEAVLLAVLMVIAIAAVAGLGWFIRSQRRPFFQSLRGKSILFLSFAFVLVGGVTMWVFGMIGDNIASRLGKQIAERHVLWHKEKVLGAISRELALARQMAQSQVLMQWAENETDPYLSTLARDELQRFRDAFRAKSYFIGLGRSRHFFFADEKVSEVSLEVVETLSKEDPDDLWFFATMEDESPYNLNVDHNTELGVTSLWINYAMRRGGETIGVVGTGVRLTQFVAEFIGRQTQSVSAMMIDGGGAIQAHVDPEKITQNVLGKETSDSSGIWAMLSTNKDREALRAHMAEVREGEREAEAIYIGINGQRSLVAVSYLAPMDWYTVSVFEPGGIVGAREKGALIGVFAGALLITAIIFVFGQNLLIVRPLLQLTDGARRLSGGDYGVRLAAAQRDEIGDLTQTFNDMASTISEYTENLKIKIQEAESARAELSDYKDHLEDLVEERTSRLRSIIDTAIDGIIVIGEDGLIQSFSPAAESIFGYRAREVVGGNVTRLMPEDTASRHDGFIERYLETGEGTAVGQTTELVGRHKDGSEFPMDLALGEAVLGEERVFTGIVRDITARKEAEAKLAEAYHVIASSIEYASRIQRSVLPDHSDLDSFMSDHFVIWEPRDRVGGDAYWCERWGRGRILALGDCTGHGVPGAFMTMIANGALDMALLETPPGDAAILLQRIHQLIQSVLGQDSAGGESDDGLELGICYLAPRARKIVFSGAGFSLFHVDDGAVTEVRGDKSGIGYRGIDRNIRFANLDVEITQGRRFYLTSDGLIDQVGGPKRRSFGKRRFKELLAEVATLPMAEQQARFHAALKEFQGDERRRDDVSIIGFTLADGA